MTQRRRVVITGLGQVTALSRSLSEFWQDICNGKSGIKKVTRFDTSKYPVKIGGEITDFDPAQYTDKREAKRIDRFALLGLAASIEAVNNSGLDMEQIDHDRCGVIIGSGIGGIEELEVQHRTLVNRGPDRVSPFCVPKLMVNAGSANIAIFYNLRGPNSSIVTACASAAHAIGEAFRQIQFGHADIMIGGGSEAALTELGMASFCALKALSRRNEEPTQASRPFDRDREGFVLSEGAGMVVLEEYEYAKKRGAMIYGEVLGYAMTCDGLHITQPSPEGEGASRAMKDAIDDAGLNLEQIDYINAHGTGTQLNDASETMAIKRVFGDQAKKVSISSTKSHLGHLLGASGGVELLISALAITHDVIPPTINLENASEECDLDYTPLQPKEKKLQFAMSNSFGFGGHNASLVIGKV